MRRVLVRGNVSQGASRSEAVQDLEGEDKEFSLIWKQAEILKGLQEMED